LNTTPTHFCAVWCIINEGKATVHSHIYTRYRCFSLFQGTKKELRFAAASSVSAFNGELILAAESDLKLHNLHIRTKCSVPVVV
jgi:hypothetical protein